MGPPGPPQTVCVCPPPVSPQAVPPLAAQQRPRRRGGAAAGAEPLHPRLLQPQPGLAGAQLQPHLGFGSGAHRPGGGYGVGEGGPRCVPPPLPLSAFSVRPLPKGLRWNRSLLSLSLAHNDIGDEGALRLAQVGLGPPRLRVGEWDGVGEGWDQSRMGLGVGRGQSGMGLERVGIGAGWDQSGLDSEWDGVRMGWGWRGMEPEQDRAGVGWGQEWDGAGGERDGIGAGWDRSGTGPAP